MLEMAGEMSASKVAMIRITTVSSINVKADAFRLLAWSRELGARRGERTGRMWKIVEGRSGN